MTALTLAQLAKLETDPMKKGIMQNLLRDARIMELIPWETSDSLKVFGLRWRNLPTSAAFRKLNAGYATGFGDVEEVWEALYGFGTDIQFDSVVDKVKNYMTDPIALQIEMHIKAKALVFNDYFINGDHATDPDGFEGLKKRVAGMPSRQTVYAAGSTSAALDPTASTANARAFLNKWARAFHYCAGGQPNAILCNEEVYLGFGEVIRYAQIAGANFLDVTKDSFDRDIITYKGVPMIDVGLKLDQSTEIITLTETGGTGSANATSAYFVHFGTDEHGVTGAQLAPPAFYDPLNGGEMESAPAKLRRFDWWVGLFSMGSRGITRLRNLLAPTSWT